MDTLYLCVDEMLVLVHNSFLFRTLYRARSPLPNDDNSIVRRYFHPSQITGENGACPSKPCYAVNCDRQVSIKASGNHGNRLFHLIKSRGCKVDNGDMFGEQTDCIENLIREEFLRK